MTAFADMFSVQFIGEDFEFFSAVWAAAAERLQPLKLFKTRAMSWCRHGSLLKNQRRETLSDLRIAVKWNPQPMRSICSVFRINLAL